MMRIEKIFRDPNEKHIATLGEECLREMLADVPPKNSVLVLSDKRLYQSGPVYEVHRGNQYGQPKRSEFHVFDLSDITDLEYMPQKVTSFLIMGIVFAVIGIIFPLKTVLSSTQWNQADMLIMILGPFVSLYGAFKLFKYIRERNVVLLVIRYATGNIAVNSSIYSKSELDRFYNQLSKLTGTINEHR